MKTTDKIFSSLLLFVMILLITSCGDDSETSSSTEQTQLSKLSKTWTIQSAQQNTDRTEDFSDPDMTLSVSGAFNASSPKGPYSYSVSGSLPAPGPWATGTGSWSFGPDASTQIVRDDGVEINYLLNGNTLTLTFTCVTCDEDNSRINSAEGGWTFVFTSNP